MEIIDELENVAPRALRRLRRLRRLLGQHGHGDHDPHPGGEGRADLPAAGRRGRGGLGAGARVQGDDQQGARPDRRHRSGARGDATEEARATTRCDSDDRQLRLLHLQPRAVSGRARGRYVEVVRNDAPASRRCWRRRARRRGDLARARRAQVRPGSRSSGEGALPRRASRSGRVPGPPVHRRRLRRP